MATSQKTLDGSFTLAQLQNTLTVEENLGFKHTTDLQKRDAPPPANVATFEDDAGYTPKRPLVLVHLKPGEDLEAVKAAQKKQGRNFLFSGAVFISKADAQVAGFR